MDASIEIQKVLSDLNKLVSVSYLFAIIAAGYTPERGNSTFLGRLHFASAAWACIAGVILVYSGVLHSSQLKPGIALLGVGVVLSIGLIWRTHREAVLPVADLDRSGDNAKDEVPTENSVDVPKRVGPRRHISGTRVIGGGEQSEPSAGTGTNGVPWKH
jgi:hypothetical protein